MGADVTCFAATLPWGFSPSPSPLAPARSHLRALELFSSPPPAPLPREPCTYPMLLPLMCRGYFRQTLTTCCLSNPGAAGTGVHHLFKTSQLRGRCCGLVCSLVWPGPQRIAGVRPGTTADPRRTCRGWGRSAGRRQAERGPAESQRARSDRKQAAKTPAVPQRAPCTRDEGCLSQNTLSCRLTLGLSGASCSSTERADSVRPEKRLSRRLSGLSAAGSGP